MSEIQYICLSDMHLGASNSLLTPLRPSISGETKNENLIAPLETSPILKETIETLKFIVRNNNRKIKPKLILNGDLLELALANTNEAGMVFERLLEQLFPQGEKAVFDSELIFIPGNHDHHLWETAREAQYLNYVSQLKEKYLPEPWHTTKMFNPDPVPSLFLKGLINRNASLKNKVSVNVVYPNLGILDTEGKKCVVFSHGHYVESLYSLMTTLKTMIIPDREKPRHIWDIEAENFAWIDFFWSTLGRSGEVGKDVESIYNKIQVPEKFDELLRQFSKSFSGKVTDKVFMQWLIKTALDYILPKTVGTIARRERGDTSNVLSEDARCGLKCYIEELLPLQMKRELKDKPIPEQVTFIFGHTHKPFQELQAYRGFKKAIHIFNSGGWVVDTIKEEPFRGAAAILVDDNLDTVSLRLYNEQDYRTRVEAPSQHPFFYQIDNLVKSEQHKFEELTRLIWGEVKNRIGVLEEEIDQT
ncbi:metallophosphoesterase [Limibacter armeniacum]|uniref:metallophosphoesterase n=1 Tax=Limibacter armeniacum TaxID=466084 RepID=UPI002FE517CE